MFLSLFHRLISGVATVGDVVRRIRYTRAELQRMSVSEVRGGTSTVAEPFRWVGPVGPARRSAALAPVDSEIIYHLHLPPSSVFTVWCATVASVGDDRHCLVDFEILARVAGRDVSARRTLPSRASSRGPGWRILRLGIPQSGAAELVLRSQARGPCHAGMMVMWGDPRVEVPRSAADAMSRLSSAVSRLGVRGLWRRALSSRRDALYAIWTREQTPSRRTLRSQRQASAAKTQLFTLITVVTDLQHWKAHPPAESLRRQSYANWEWLLVVPTGDAAQSGSVVRSLARDARVRLVSVPSGATTAEAWNAALREARGDFAALLSEDDALGFDALYECSAALERMPDCDLLYSDEDQTKAGSRTPEEVHLKPEWSPELLLSSNYIGRLAFVRVETARRLGGFRTLGGNADGEWEFLLRLSRSDARIQRVSRCLYHRRGVAHQAAAPGGIEAVRDHLAERGVAATVTAEAGLTRSVWPIRGEPLVSIVIPNRNAAVVLKQAIAGILDHTAYTRWELVIVDNGSTDAEVLELYRTLQRQGRSRIVPFDRPFNFSAACNAGAAAASGSLLLFLNNDIEVLEPDWLEELVRWAQLPEIGVVGARLLYPDHTIQHAGVVFGLGLVGHLFARAGEHERGPFGSSDTYRNVLAVTGACQMMRREVFDRVGGYDERYRLAFSDVVLCMEAWRAGYRVMYTPYARLMHHESYTRKSEDWPEDLALLVDYLAASGFVDDPYFHPELDPTSSIPSLRPPFAPTPTQVVQEYLRRIAHPAAV